MFKTRLNGCSLAHKLHGNVALFKEKLLRLRTNVSVYTLVETHQKHVKLTDLRIWFDA